MMKINKPEKIVANDDVNLIKEDKKRILDHLEERIKEAYAGNKKDEIMPLCYATQVQEEILIFVPN